MRTTLRTFSNEFRVTGYRAALVSLAALKCWIAVLNLSRHPGLQNPTTSPSYSANESACTGSPDQGQVSLIQSAMSS